VAYQADGGSDRARDLLCALALAGPSLTVLDLPHRRV
jgi:hypothetical protein